MDLAFSGAPPDLAAEPEASSSTVVPSLGSLPSFTPRTSAVPLVGDERALAQLLRKILDRSGLSINEAANRCGVHQATFRQYLNGRRDNPGFLWIVRYANALGARVVVELPERVKR